MPSPSSSSSSPARATTISHPVHAVPHHRPHHGDIGDAVRAGAMAVIIGVESVAGHGGKHLPENAFEQQMTSLISPLATSVPAITGSPHPMHPEDERLLRHFRLALDAADIRPSDS